MQINAHEMNDQRSWNLLCLGLTLVMRKRLFGQRLTEKLTNFTEL